MTEETIKAPDEHSRCGNCYWFDLLNEKYGEGLCLCSMTAPVRKLECDYCKDFYDKETAMKRVEALIKGRV